MSGEVSSKTASTVSVDTDKTLQTVTRPVPSGEQPKQRVIKKITSIDPTKLRGLNIESKILSALTKLNGSDEKIASSVSKVVPAEAKKSPSIANQSKAVLSTNAVSQQSVFVASTAHETQAKRVEYSPTKKVHVLSDVVLSENKLDLKKITTAISTSLKRSDILIGPSQDAKKQESTISRQSLDGCETIATTNIVQPNKCVSPVRKSSVEPTPKSSSSTDTSQSTAPTMPSIAQKPEELVGFSSSQYDESKTLFKSFQNKVSSTPSQPSSDQAHKQSTHSVKTVSPRASIESSTSVSKDNITSSSAMPDVPKQCVQKEDVHAEAKTSEQNEMNVRTSGNKSKGKQMFQKEIFYTDFTTKG